MNKLTLSAKLWGFAAILLIFITILAGFSIWSTRNILDANQDYSKAVHLENFLVEKEVDHLNWVGKVKNLFVDNAVQKQYQNHLAPYYKVFQSLQAGLEDHNPSPPPNHLEHNLSPL